MLPTVRSIGPRDRLNQLWQVSDNISIRSGTHFLKAGVLIARRNWTFDEAVNPRSTFNFDGTVTAGGTTRRATTSSPTSCWAWQPARRSVSSPSPRA